MRDYLRYFLVSVLAWIFIEQTTAFYFDLGRWVSYMPDIWVFYLGFPLLLTILIYRLKFRGARLFAAVVLQLIVVEILFTGNAMLFTFPMLLLAIPIGLAIYSIITYVPLWIVENSIREHKRAMALFLVVWLFVFIVGTINHLKGG
jgi:hypothetical protein